MNISDFLTVWKQIREACPTNDALSTAFKLTELYIVQLRNEIPK